MIIVTGGAGFIGSNLIRALNQRGVSNILLVDHLANGRKMHNIADLDIADYMDKAEFIEQIESPTFLNGVRAVFHQGACSATTEWDGQYSVAPIEMVMTPSVSWLFLRRICLEPRLVRSWFATLTAF